MYVYIYIYISTHAHTPSSPSFPSANDFPIWSKTNSFYGKPFIWCTLLNFGGQQGLSGNMPAVQTGVEQAVHQTMIGVGITMEGIWQNYPVFEYTLALGWNDTAPAPYTAAYAQRRYGNAGPSSTQVGTAWDALYSTFYTGGGSFGSLITAYPTLTLGTALPPLLQAHLGTSVPRETIHAYATSLLPAAEQAVSVGEGDACPYQRLNNVYLANWAPGFDPTNPPYPGYSLSAAEQWCSQQGFLCGGITLAHNIYEVTSVRVCLCVGVHVSLLKFLTPSLHTHSLSHTHTVPCWLDGPAITDRGDQLDQGVFAAAGAGLGGSAALARGHWHRAVVQLLSC
jgi:hypothetical protein